MIKKAPKIDQRSAKDIAEQVKFLLTEYAEEFRGKELKGVSAALVNIFARFAEIIIQKLNQVPDKNFLAFLDLLGASRLPPQPARVPLRFSLVAGSIIDAVVPAGTQVAAPPAEGEKEPVIFETERELVVTAANLESVFVRDPQQDMYGDYSSIITATTSFSIPVFRGNKSIEHILYIGHSELLGFPDIDNLKLKINLIKALGDQAEIKWQVWQVNEKVSQWKDIVPTSDVTEGLTKANSTNAQDINFGDIQSVPLKAVNSLTNRWLRCCLLTPITLADELKAGMVRASQLPEINQIEIEVTLNSTNLEIEAAFTNQLSIDLSKDFFPFGEKPKFGDTLYLANREAFSQKDAYITLNIVLTNPATGGEEPPIPRTKTDGNPQLKWEFWDGRNWRELIALPQEEEAEQAFVDTTVALTISNTVSFTFSHQPAKTNINGVENYWIRVRIVAGNYGVEAYYQEITRTVAIDVDGETRQVKDYVFTPATFQPPSIQLIAANYSLTKSKAPEVVFAFNDAVFSKNLITTPRESSEIAQTNFAPFNQTITNQPALYLGFNLPSDRTEFPNRTISLFNRIADVKYGENLVPISPTQSQKIGDDGATVSHHFWLTNDTSKSVRFKLMSLGTTWSTKVPDSLEVEAGTSQQVEVQVTIPPGADLESSDRGLLRLRTTDNLTLIYSASFETFVGKKLSQSQQLQLAWQYWNGTQWAKLKIRDDSENFTRSGLIEFLPPADFSPKEDFNLPPLYWLRIQWKEGDYQLEPRLERVLLNTTMAAQTVTIRNEIIGSSDGSENQTFRTTKTPILMGQQLEVRELELPSVQEQEKLEQEEGKDAIPPILDSTERPKEIWIRWHEVTDFYSSGPRDRHYLLNHLSGEIRFSDGLNGLIPPVGSGNLRMSCYQTGGGKGGNKPAGTIVQLKTTVPYVDKVTNNEAATGGAEAETLDSLIERVPRQIRHRNRAVTVEDYEDLAKLASTEVARAKCIPLRNLAANSLNQEPTLGEVSVIIVPHTTDAQPLPSLELIRCVQDFLKIRALPTVNISVIGPLYVGVQVKAQIAVTSLEGASEVVGNVESQLASFLHPLSGGFEGRGWDFGREPYKSDLYRLLEGISGVDHVRSLQVKEVEELKGAKQTGRFLVYSQNHEINVIFPQL
ncbi:MAG: putative baseplate assembly protein [Symploca sp. SIO2B6]|nr:putative baseplate assembly protein [Symploca sp. SIO2B6]